MTVDEILHGGEYTDRRGRRWTRTRRNNWLAPRRPRVSALADEDQMRLLIERDMHRDACEGLGQCWNHPVAHVAIDRQLGLFDAFNPGSDDWGGDYDSLPEAMDAAYRLAVSE